MQELLGKTARPEVSQPAAAVLTATARDLEGLVASHPYLVVDCWAPWCGPCRRVGPVIEALAGEFAGRIAFAKLNTDENQQVAQAFNISAIPTILLFANGRLAGRITGAYPLEMMRAEILGTFRLG